MRKQSNSHLMQNFVIRPMEQGEIPLLAHFPPESWNLDFTGFLNAVFHKPGFRMYVMHGPDGPIAGCGQIVRNGKTAWLGNIIIEEEFRGRGLGTVLTRKLLEECRLEGVKEIHLIATTQGEPVYRKLGFRPVCDYLCFGECKNPASLPVPAPGIRPLGEPDIPEVERLDRLATGEDRSVFFRDHLPGAYGLFREGRPGGFFLPGWENGPVIAGDSEAGLALLAFKIRNFSLPVVIPEGNREALKMLESAGCSLRWKLPRMSLGDPGNWNPGMIFSRASGYCG